VIVSCDRMISVQVVAVLAMVCDIDDFVGPDDTCVNIKVLARNDV
jgi:hypothetical protein